MQKYKIIAIMGKAGCGKAQPVDTLIPTPNGWKQLGDIQVGDIVFNRYGQPTTVLGVFPQGEIPAYQITFEDGRTTICGQEHLWTVIDGHKRNRVLTTQEILSIGVKTKKGNNRFKIPVNLPVNYPKQNLPLDPYLIGAFLGDGCCTEKLVTLSSTDTFILEEIGRITDTTPVPYSPNTNTSYSYKFRVKEALFTTTTNNCVKQYLQTKEFFEKTPELMQNCYNKRIPYIYKISSLEQRLSLLQGLFDTDGCIVDRSSDNRTHNVTYSTVNYLLALDIQEVLFSCGFRCSISKDNRADKYTGGVCYTLHVACAEKDKYKLFRLPRKRNIALTHINWQDKKNMNYMALTNITALNQNINMVCILVDNPEHLYLTNNYIVTHNTTLLKNVVSYMPHYFNALISCTTRPPRANEKEGRDYFFVTEEEFAAADLLEQTVFNNWHYGTAAHTLSPDKINIGVFSPDGVRNLMERRDIELITIYLVANDKARLLRQLNREEQPNVYEIIRRFGTDEADFADLSDITYTLLFNNSLEEFEAIVEYIANGLRAHWDN